MRKTDKHKGSVLSFNNVFVLQNVNSRSAPKEGNSAFQTLNNNTRCYHKAGIAQFLLFTQVQDSDILFLLATLVRACMTQKCDRRVFSSLSQNLTESRISRSISSSS